MVWEEIYVYAPKILRVLAVSAESSRRCMFSVPDTKAQANTVVLYRVWCFSDFESSCLVMYPLVEYCWFLVMCGVNMCSAACTTARFFPY